MERQKDSPIESAVDQLIRETAGVDVPKYIQNIYEQYSETQEFMKLAWLSKTIDPYPVVSESVDSLTKSADDPVKTHMSPDALAFLDGALIGIRAARTVLPDDLDLQNNLGLIIDNQVQFAFGSLLDDYSEESKREFADMIYELGIEGYEAAEDYYRFFESIISQLLTKGESRELARWGFGFVISALSIATNNDAE